ncbi:hypothetical protein EV182_003611, partial [Spiromyces aspiralis]
MVLHDQLYTVYSDCSYELLIANVSKVILEHLGRVGGKGGSVSLVEVLTILGFFMTLTKHELGFIIKGGGFNFSELYFVHDPDAPLDSCCMATAWPAALRSSISSSVLGPQHILKKVSGRKVWLYSGRLGYCDVFVKVEVQGESCQSEIAIMQRLLDNDVSHTACMLHGFRLNRHNGFCMEVMVLEHHGQPLCKFFRYLHSLHKLDQDTISAVVRHIITALFGVHWAGTLHCDVSIRNIVAQLRGCEVEATLINWGYARLEPTSHHLNSNPNNDATVGTMAFRSLWMVNRCSGRTIIDDIESLFYAVCYGLVYIYANESLDDIFWVVSQEGQAEYRAMTLEKFSRLTEELFGDSICHIDAGVLKVLKDLHEVLFSRVN